MDQHNRLFTDVRSVLRDDCESSKEPLCALLAYSMYQPTADKLRQRIASYQSSDVYVDACVEDGVPLGLIAYRLCEQTATILDIAVHKHARGRGIGSFLIDGLLYESDTSCVLAETDGDAVGFYRKYGFAIAQTQTVYDRKRYLCRYIPLEIKTIKRDNWSRVLSSSFRFAEKTYGECGCVVGLLTIEDVTAPLKKTVFERELVLADKGYRWLQIAPENESWWLTVMLDPGGNIVQYYFDVTDRNILDGERSRFYDLYLDVVVLPDGKAALLDQDELDAALTDGVISNAQYQKANETANRLYGEVPLQLTEIKRFVLAVYDELSV